MKANEEGFFYPVVGDVCINCGLCVQHCPALSPTKNTEPFSRISYVARLKDTNLLMRSTSGGVFAGIAEKVIDDGGCVVGAAYDKDLFVNQEVVSDKEGLEKLKGSKYVESCTADSFLKVKKILDGQKTVLYSGTPCQIEGLKKFLGKEYPNLYTIDLICHGVPSQKLFHKYLEWLSLKLGEKIIAYNFRDKSCGGWLCGFGKTKTKTKTKKIIGGRDPYYASFLRCELYRESCYSCPFSSMDRPGDLTIGDFFEVIKFYPKVDRKKGISLCVVNSEKGLRLFNVVKQQFELLPIKEEQYLPEKGNLHSPSPRPAVRSRIYKEIDLSSKEYFSRFKETKLYFHLYRCVLDMIPVSLKKFIKCKMKRNI